MELQNKYLLFVKDLFCNLTHRLNCEEEFSHYVAPLLISKNNKFKTPSPEHHHRIRAWLWPVTMQMNTQTHFMKYRVNLLVLHLSRCLIKKKKKNFKDEFKNASTDFVSASTPTIRNLIKTLTCHVLVFIIRL